MGFQGESPSGVKLVVRLEESYNSRRNSQERASWLRQGGYRQISGDLLSGPKRRRAERVDAEQRSLPTRCHVGGEKPLDQKAMADGKDLGKKSVNASVTGPETARRAGLEEKQRNKEAEVQRQIMKDGLAQRPTTEQGDHLLLKRLKLVHGKGANLRKEESSFSGRVAEASQPAP